MIFLKKHHIRFGVGLVILGVFLYFGRSYMTQFHLLFEVHPGWVVAAAISFLLTRFINAEVLRLSLLEIGNRIGRGEGFLLNMVMGYTNLILPRAGLTAPIAYLKTKHKVPYSRFGALMMPTVVIQLIVSSFCGFIVILYAIYSKTATWNQQQYLLLLFGGVCAANLILICCHLPLKDKWQGRIARFFRRFNETWILLRQRFGFVTHIAFLQLGITIMRALRMHMAFLAIGVNAPFPAVFTASLCAQFAMLISLTPGALGFREAAVGAVMFQFAENPEIAITAAILDRIIITTCIVLVGQVGLITIIRPILNKLPDPNSDIRTSPEK